MRWWSRSSKRQMSEQKALRPIDLTLSDQELDYLQDTGLLRARFQIRTKLEQLLVAAEQEIKAMIPQLPIPLPDVVLQKAGKLSRGENYRLLPYHVLDYPRYFSGEAFFAFRCIFWWGHDISCVLLLQGEVTSSYRQLLTERAGRLYGQGIWVCISDSPWEHHFDEDNLSLLDDFDENTLKQHFEAHPFVKLVRRLPLADYRQTPAFCRESFGIFLAATS